MKKAYVLILIALLSPLSFLSCGSSALVSGGDQQEGSGESQQQQEEEEEEETLETLAISNLAVTSTDTEVTLTWTNPSQSHFASVTVVKNESALPTSVSDGTSICQGNIATCADDDLAMAEEGYYGVFIHNTNSEVSLGGTISGHLVGYVGAKTGLANYAAGARFFDGYFYLVNNANFYRIPFDEDTATLGAVQTLASFSFNAADLFKVSDTVFLVLDNSNKEVKTVTFTDSTLGTIDSASTLYDSYTLATSMVQDSDDRLYVLDYGSGELKLYSPNDTVDAGDAFTLRGMDVYDGVVYFGDATSSAYTVHTYDIATETLDSIDGSELVSENITPRWIEVDSRYLYVVGNPGDSLMVYQHDGTFVRKYELSSMITLSMASNDEGYVFVATTNNQVHVIRTW